MKIEQIGVERGYVVTKEGTLLNPKGLKIGRINIRGYLDASIRVEGKTVKLQTHRLQAFQKYGILLYNKGFEVRHLNSDKEDNSWKNIALGTHKANMLDVPKELRVKSAIHAASFLKKYNNEEIIMFYELHKSYKVTMEKFNISSKGTLNYILKSKKST
jgi:hypothetical protein